MHIIALPNVYKEAKDIRTFKHMAVDFIQL